MDYNSILKSFNNWDFDDFCSNTFQEQLSASPYREYDTGATKLVIFTKEDYVIKIPFCGDSDYYNEEYYYYPFCNAGGYDSCEWNYCEVELDLYKEAVRYGVEEFFLEPIFIGFSGLKHNHPIYVQEKAIIYEEYDSKHSKEEIEKTGELCAEHDLYCFHKAWLTDFLDYYSLEDLQRLEKFIDDFYISDLHGGNLGYRRNGKPVIIDYAGYDD